MSRAEQAKPRALPAGKPGSGNDEHTTPHPGRADTSSSARLRRWGLGAALMAAVVVAYHPAWHGGFIWDDESHVVNNGHLVAPDGLRRIWFSLEAPQYYPLVFTTFRLERGLWGLDPTGYHFTNLLLHGGSALLLWGLLRQLRVRGAWLAAAVFALHPVNVESVAWITERKNTLSLLFFLLSLSWYLRFDRQADAARQPHVAGVSPYERRGPAWIGSPQLYYGLSLLAFVLALLSKTAVAPLPVVLWLMTWWERGRVEQRDVWRSLPFFAVGLVLIPLTVVFEHQAGSEIVRNDGFWARLAGAGWAVWFYLYKALLPVNLSFIYPRWRIDPARALAYVPGLLWVAGFLACWRYRRQWGRAVLFGLGYFVVLLLPALGFVNIYFMRYSLVSDHWQYAAIIGPIALVAAGLSALPDWLCRQRHRRLEAALCVIVLVVLGGLTWREAGTYVNGETVWRTSLRRHPDAWLPHYNLGTALGMSGHPDEAVEHLRAAIRIEPTRAEAYYNLGMVYALQHRMDEAVASYRAALRLEPDNPKPLNNLAWIYATCPRANVRNGAEAVRLAEQACGITKGSDPVMLDTLAAAYAEAGRFDAAIKTAEELCALAAAAHDRTLADAGRLRLELYKAGKPYREEWK